MVGIKARERRGEAEDGRALDYNGFNTVDPYFVLEVANALIAPPSEWAARRPTESQVRGS
jgi:hypothetical protein